MLQRLPLGVQDFEELRNNDYLYIDKTARVFHLVNNTNIVFLSRPRRFGKSLFVNTLSSYFSGKRELFEGLAIEQLETQWKKHPVLKFDFSIEKYTEVDTLNKYLDYALSRYEKIYGKTEGETTFAIRLAELIERAREQSGERVVLLVDEYDAPLLDSIHDEDRKAKLRDILRRFYSPLKSMDYHLRFVFFTGITTFSQMSIFSELNNIQNISMLDNYSDICGITEEELLRDFTEHIAALADKNKETYDEACKHLKLQYDGYHFSEQCEDIYNPYSLINVLATHKYDNYWFASGTPTFLVNLVKKFDVQIKDLEGLTADRSDFDLSTDIITKHLPVFYQSGYITIKKYDKTMDEYTLGYPNKEVKEGFAKCLLPLFIPDYNPNPSEFALNNYVIDLYEGDVESFLQRMQAFFASISNNMNNKTEKDFQTIIYLMSIHMGVDTYVQVEEESAIGRSDLVIALPTHVYIFEFKFEGSSENALVQIERKKYALKYASSGKTIVKIGVNFSSESRTLDGWTIEY